MSYALRTKTGLNRHLILWPTIALVIIAILTLVVLESTNATHFFHKSQPAFVNPKNNTPTQGGASATNTKGDPGGTPANAHPPTSSTEPGDSKSSTGSANKAPLVAPSGDFVSNHHPNLSGSPAPYTVTSVCTTTPGATCNISLTKDGVIKKLNAQTTDRGGSAYWNWKLQDIGLTAGSWKITATATLNGQTMSSSDALNLEVSP